MFLNKLFLEEFYSLEDLRVHKFKVDIQDEFVRLIVNFLHQNTSINRESMLDVCSVKFCS